MMPIYRRNMDSYPHQTNQSGYQQNFQSYIPSNPSNPSNPPMFYQSWPQRDNYSYSYPMPFNSCCNHGNFPGFHGHQPIPSPPIHYCPAPYCPEPYPVCYIPHPNYSAGIIPGHEHGNCMARNHERHCFGEPYHRGDDRGVRVEEKQDPNIVEPERNRSLIPVHMKGYPYPVAWVPEGYVKEKVRPSEAEEPRKYVTDSGDETRGQDRKKEYPFPFFWMPYGSEEEEGKVKKDEDAKGGLDKKSGDHKNRFQFPIVWPKEVEDENGKAASASLKRVDDLPYVFKFIPMENLGSSKMNKENGEEAKTEEKAVAQKNGTVKPELPPVCLRVEPLPKKKNGNAGSRSRSPSPPKRQISIDDTVSNDKEPKESLVGMEKVGGQPQVSVLSSEHTDASDPTAERDLGKKALSDVEAALRIQSAYRGYDIRRSQPLEKLKRISKVREQVADVRNRIEALALDVRRDDKQKLIVGETIMRLLLQLDTIQGLLPSLRDVRKTLAKELMSLQEKLDSLVIESDKCELETCPSRPVDVLGVEAEEVKFKQVKPEETESDKSCDDVPKSSCDVIESGQDPELLPATDSESDATSEGDCSDFKHGEASSEATVEHEDNVGELTDIKQVDKACESIESRSEEDFEETKTIGNPPEVVDKDDSTETDEGHTKRAEEENCGEVQSVMASQGVAEESMVAKEDAETHQSEDLPVIELDNEPNDDAPLRDEIPIEVEKPDQVLKEKPDNDDRKFENSNSKNSIEVEKPEQVLEERSLLAPEVSEAMSSNDSETRSESKENWLMGAENEKIREMIEKLMEARKEQLNVISGLSAKVRDLEKKLYRKKKLRTKQNRRSVVNVK